MQELLADFKTEAAEHLHIFINGLLELEKSSDPVIIKKFVEEIFREIHSAKGAARAVNLSEIERLCQSLESALASLKSERIGLNSTLFDLLHGAGNMLDAMVSDLTSGKKTVPAEDIMSMVFRLTDAAQGKLPAIQTEKSMEGKPTPVQSSVVSNPSEIEKNPSLSSELQSQQETVRISIEKLRALMIQAEEFIAAKSMYKFFSKEISEISSHYYNFWRLSESRMKEITPGMNADPYALEDLRRWYKESARELHERLTRLNRICGQYQHNTSRMIDELLLDIRKTLLVPFSLVLDVFPKMVRDLAKDSAKEISLTIQGAETEIDRRILEEIKVPLIHLVRNCIDHGIEKPEYRLKNGKSRQGTLEILMRKSQEREIEVIIRDDGAGIDPEKVIKSALKEDIISEEAAHQLSKEEALQLIFKSGVSTSAMITDLSGRGLGLAIVSDKISKLGGQIRLESDAGTGTCFTILLPLTLATFHGVLIRLGDNLVMVPLNSVEKVIRIEQTSVRTIENQETFLYENHHTALIRLSDVLGFTSIKAKSRGGSVYIIIFAAGKKKTAFVVDEILGEQEGIIKPLGGQLLNVRHVSGATVLGNGKVVPVIDTFELLETISNIGVPRQNLQTGSTGEVESKSVRILVAEDSLTSRSLLRNLLESAGYDVTTAIDGWEGYTFLKQGGFDLVVSDIEMPRMNGFELTTKIRSEPEISSLPVILVTALESDEDRQRGLEAGANAYIAKSSFEGSNLVSTIQRLI